MQGFAANFLWPGTADWSGWAAVDTALKALHAIGMERMRQHSHQLVQDAAVLLQQAFGTQTMLGVHTWCPKANTACSAAGVCPHALPGGCQMCHSNAEEHILLEQPHGFCVLRLCTMSSMQSMHAW